MSGCRIAIGLSWYALLVAPFVGCGGAVQQGGPDDDDPVGRGGSAAAPPVGRAGSPGSPAAGGSGAGSPSGGTSSAGQPAASGSGGQAFPDDPPNVGPGCDTQELPAPDRECDPFGANTCGAGSGCYPFVDHPDGDGCGAQTYGTVCLPAGVGTQGMICGDQTGDWCAPGFVCVVGQGAGKRCAALCPLGVPDSCGGGLVCSDLDVEGYGVCG